MILGMDEDGKALDDLRDRLLDQFPPGPKREFWLNWLAKLALETRCPQWPNWKQRPPHRKKIGIRA